MSRKIPGAVLLVNLNKTYESAKQNSGLLEQYTLGDWDVSRGLAEQVRLVIGVHRNVMESFYRMRLDKDGKAILIEIPPTAKRKHRRFRWEGDDVSGLFKEFRERSLRSDDGAKQLSKMPSGAGRRFLPAVI